MWDSIQFSSVVQSCPTFCDQMDCSMPGFPVLHYPPEFAQTRVHRVSDAIQSSHPLLPSSPPAFNLSQHQGLFQWVSCLMQTSFLLDPKCYRNTHSSELRWTIRATSVKLSTLALRDQLNNSSFIGLAKRLILCFPYGVMSKLLGQLNICTVLMLKVRSTEFFMSGL